jgi:type VI secretion system protein ImpH
LPRHYTELLLTLAREAKGEEKFALRDWLDLFNHRMISLFYRSATKYRFYVPYERGQSFHTQPDAFTQSLFCLIGLGMPGLRQRLRVIVHKPEEEPSREKPLAQIDDLALIHFAGLLSKRTRNAWGLGALLKNYFRLPFEVVQFQGQWLLLDKASQSCMSPNGDNCQLGVNIIAGEKVWDVQGKIRIRLGPLNYQQFQDWLPDQTPQPPRKAFFLLCHLVRLYVGIELDFEVQLILRAEDVPECQMAEGPGLGPRLGWNTWIRSGPFPRDAEDSVFGSDEGLLSRARSAAE